MTDLRETVAQAIYKERGRWKLSANPGVGFEVHPVDENYTIVGPPAITASHANEAHRFVDLRAADAAIVAVLEGLPVPDNRPDFIQKRDALIAQHRGRG